MKVIKQLGDRRFEVELEDEDLKDQLNEEVILQHDYFRIKDTMFVGEIPIKVQATIGIREFHHLLKVIKDHKFMKEEHLMRDEGPAYTYNDEHTLVIEADGKRRYFARDKDKIIEITEGIWKRLQSC